MRRKLSEKDKEYIDAIAEALSEHTPKKSRYAIYFWIIAVAGFLIWASFAEVDEIVRGSGEVVPSGNNQVVQNLEGGIVKEIYVKIGDEVNKSTPLLKIENEKAKAQMLSTAIKIEELKAKIKRLKAEANGVEFDINISSNNSELTKFIDNEKSLYISRKRELLSKISALQEKINQKNSSLYETKERIKDLNTTANLMKKEIEIMKPMVEQRGLNPK